MSPARSRLGAFTTVVVALLACLSPTPSLLQAQSPTRPFGYVSSEQPIRRELPRIRRVEARDEVGFIEWPPELVGASTLTAIDLKTGQLKWTCSMDPSNGATWSIAGDYILQRAFANNIAHVVRQIHIATGEVEVPPLGDGQAAVPKDQRASHRGTHVHGDWAVTDQIVRLEDKHVVRDLDFSWEFAVSHRGKLFTFGYRDRRPTGESVLRRTDLETGRDELAVPFAELLASDAELGFGEMVAVSGDVVAISTFWRPTPNGPIVRGYKAFNLVARREIWRAVGEGRFGYAPVQFHHPDGLGHSNSISNWNPSRRRPLLIDLVTGGMKPDPDWRDPYSLLYWHTGESSPMGAVELPLHFVARNDHYAIALLGKISLICVDLETGALVWKHDVGGNYAWPAITSTGNLGEYILVPLPGGLEVFEISTGQRRVIRPTDVGLTAIAESPLPLRTSMPAGAGRVVPAQHDWWIDGLIQSLLALPLVAWGVYLFVRRRTRSRQPLQNDSPK